MIEKICESGTILARKVTELVEKEINEMQDMLEFANCVQTLSEQSILDEWVVFNTKEEAYIYFNVEIPTGE